MNTEDTPSMRITRQRRVLLDHLDGTPDFATAQEVHTQLRVAGESIGLATVYRGLQWLADAGLVDAIRMNDGEMGYRRCSPAHHHHLICRQCGRTIEISAELVETWASQVATAHGFHAPDHNVEISGLCDDCWRARDTTV